MHEEKEMETLNIENNIPHEVSELICLKCLDRWIGVYPQKTPLKELECKCGAIGYVIKTGQTIEEENECEKCNHYAGKCKLGLSHNPEIYCEYFKESGYNAICNENNKATE